MLIIYVFSLYLLLGAVVLGGLGLAGCLLCRPSAVGLSV